MEDWYTVKTETAVQEGDQRRNVFTVDRRPTTPSLLWQLFAFGFDETDAWISLEVLEVRQVKI